LAARFRAAPPPAPPSRRRAEATCPAEAVRRACKAAARAAVSREEACKAAVAAALSTPPPRRWPPPRPLWRRTRQRFPPLPRRLPPPRWSLCPCHRLRRRPCRRRLHRSPTAMPRPPKPRRRRKPRPNPPDRIGRTCGERGRRLTTVRVRTRVGILLRARWSMRYTQADFLCICFLNLSLSLTRTFKNTLFLLSFSIHHFLSQTRSTASGAFRPCAFPSSRASTTAAAAAPPSAARAPRPTRARWWPAGAPAGSASACLAPPRGWALPLAVATTARATAHRAAAAEAEAVPARECPTRAAKSPWVYGN
jgi:hypothetical protein